MEGVSSTSPTPSSVTQPDWPRGAAEWCIVACDLSHDALRKLLHRPTRRTTWRHSALTGDNKHAMDAELIRSLLHAETDSACCKTCLHCGHLNVHNWSAFEHGLHHICLGCLLGRWACSLKGVHDMSLVVSGGQRLGVTTELIRQY
ncbi:hypothetical protein RRG08_045017 [Elysia crispata]|uniref:Uncharacterized protein n=1 Tax=Elysia crispata TaxID=231223 RepID=A0AAE0Y434_9GAST|nr:hypothetical protein RRG08_045017 [Elysia crispata]